MIRNNMKRIQSKLHRTGTFDVCKISLSCFDDKKYILYDGVNSLAYFHNIDKIYNANKIFKTEKVKIKSIKSVISINFLKLVMSNKVNKKLCFVHKAFIFYFFSGIVIEGARTKVRTRKNKQSKTELLFI